MSAAGHMQPSGPSAMNGQGSRLPASLALAMMLAVAVGAPLAANVPRELRVCADPDSLPFSNDRLEGFENRIASLIAEELHATVRYTWSMQRRGFLRRTLQSGACDVVMGVPAGLPGVLATRPYYASTYVFVAARERNLELGNFDAPALRGLRIGLQAIGAEGANTPPASALARRGLMKNVVGFAMWGPNGASEERARIIDAVAAGTIDTAVVWGPLAGYYARRYSQRLVLTPVTSDPLKPELPFVYEIALAVRSGDDALRAQLEAVLDRRQQDIRAILDEYGVPPAGASTRALDGVVLGQAVVSRDPRKEH